MLKGEGKHNKKQMGFTCKPPNMIFTVCSVKHENVKSNPSPCFVTYHVFWNELPADQLPADQYVLPKTFPPPPRQIGLLAIPSILQELNYNISI
jgi:hypothetical protein